MLCNTEAGNPSNNLAMSFGMKFGNGWNEPFLSSHVNH
jgi:hypothetical protein